VDTRPILGLREVRAAFLVDLFDAQTGRSQAGRRKADRASFVEPSRPVDFMTFFKLDVDEEDDFDEDDDSDESDESDDSDDEDEDEDSDEEEGETWQVSVLTFEVRPA